MRKEKLITRAVILVLADCTASFDGDGCGCGGLGVSSASLKIVSRRASTPATAWDSSEPQRVPPLEDEDDIAQDTYLRRTFSLGCFLRSQASLSSRLSRSSQYIHRPWSLQLGIPSIDASSPMARALAVERRGRAADVACDAVCWDTRTRCGTGCGATTLSVFVSSGPGARQRAFRLPRGPDVQSPLSYFIYSYSYVTAAGADRYGFVQLSSALSLVVSTRRCSWQFAKFSLEAAEKLKREKEGGFWTPDCSITKPWGQTCMGGLCLRQAAAGRRSL